MSERGETAQPGKVPATRPTTGTLFAALYGELVRHPWRDAESVNDAYSLFYQRSLAMGWLDDRESGRGHGFGDHTHSAPGLWAMNDAGWGAEPPAPGAGVISWFQVEASAVPGDRPLPVQAFLKCAESATARAGTLHLSAVQVLLPVQGIDASSRPPYAIVPSIRTAQWFAESDPRSRTPVKVNINSGQDPSISAVATQLVDHLGDLEQDMFTGRPDEAVGRDAVLPPPFDDRFWNGPPRHGLSLRGELAEWSCEAIGWLAEVLTDSVAQLGVRAPLLLTVARAF